MAGGGDYDGDLNMFSFDKDLLDVAKATEDRIRQLPVEDLDQQVKDRMMELELEKAHGRGGGTRTMRIF